MNDQTIRVLLVEDDPAETRLIRSLLAEVPSMHFIWERVEKLSVATDILRHEPFDLVLLDLWLPDSQGLDTFSRLYPHAICLPIIILTNIKDELLALKAIQLGAQDYFVKGQGDGEFLGRALRHAIERKHTETTLRVKIRELTVVAQQLEQAVRIGHELNNALATVMLSIEALLGQIPSEDLKHTDLQVVHDEVSRMGRLVANLLQLNHRRRQQASKAQVREDLASRPGLLQYLHTNNIVPVQDEFTYFFHTVEAGTAGYILKGDAANELIAMIYRVFQEGVLIPRTLGPRLLHDSPEQIKTSGMPSYKQLSHHERDIVQFIAQGCTNKEIAQRLSMSVRTVERHRSSIMNKLGLQNRAELIAFAVKHGFLNGDDTK
jgi:DNA-binding NarL/FixJ family response regulator